MTPNAAAKTAQYCLDNSSASPDGGAGRADPTPGGGGTNTERSDDGRSDTRTLRDAGYRDGAGTGTQRPRDE